MVGQCLKGPQTTAQAVMLGASASAKPHKNQANVLPRQPRSTAPGTTGVLTLTFRCGMLIHIAQIEALRGAHLCRVLIGQGDAQQLCSERHAPAVGRGGSPHTCAVSPGPIIEPRAIGRPAGFSPGWVAGCKHPVWLTGPAGLVLLHGRGAGGVLLVGEGVELEGGGLEARLRGVAAGVAAAMHAVVAWRVGMLQVGVAICMWLMPCPCSNMAVMVMCHSRCL